jgi:hypothetical protein
MLKEPLAAVAMLALALSTPASASAGEEAESAFECGVIASFIGRHDDARNLIARGAKLALEHVSLIGQNGRATEEYRLGSINVLAADIAGRGVHVGRMLQASRDRAHRRIFNVLSERKVGGDIWANEYRRLAEADFLLRECRALVRPTGD